MGDALRQSRLRHGWFVLLLIASVLVLVPSGVGAQDDPGPAPDGVEAPQPAEPTEPAAEPTEPAEPAEPVEPERDENGCPQGAVYDPVENFCVLPAEEPEDTAHSNGESGDEENDGDDNPNDNNPDSDNPDGDNPDGDNPDGDNEDEEDESEESDEPQAPPVPTCGPTERLNESNQCVPRCPPGFVLQGNGVCAEVLNPDHPCVAAGRVPPGVTNNAQLSGYAYLAGTRECVTQAEFQRRVSNFEAAAESEKDALDGLNQLTTEVLGLEADLERIDVRLASARSLVRAARVDARNAQLELVSARQELNRTSRLLAAEERLFQRQVVAAYMGGGDAAAVADAVLSVDNANLFQSTLDYAEVVLADRQLTIERIEMLEEGIVELTEQLDAKVAAAEAKADRATDLEASLDELRAEQTELVAAHENRLEASAASVAEIRSRKGEFAAELGAIDGASKDIEEILAEAQLITGSVTNFDGEFIPPLTPLEIVSFFGPRLHPILGYVRSHNGLDLDGVSGAAIYASSAGTVIIAGDQGGYGNTVVIDHGGGLSTLYAHQSAVAVDVGDTVKKGEVIGYVGSTGLSTGPHLHWEVRIYGVPVDPMPYLARSIAD